MKIRSVTAFVDVEYPLKSGEFSEIGSTLRETRDALNKDGYDVQTIRLATQPFPEILSEVGPSQAADLARDIEAVAFVHEIDYVALGPVRIDDPVAYIEAMPDMLGSTENVFASIDIATHPFGISLPRIRRAAELIRRVAHLSEDGFANLRLAALANVQAWAPFFPAAYHRGGPPRIAIATESADLALSAIGGAHTLENARETLISEVEAEAARIEATVTGALGGHNVSFEGIDFSLAPFPEDSRSIGAALERLGIPGMGMQGTLLTAAFLTGALDQAQFTRTGFCGLMLPVLEDPILAQRAADKQLLVTDLLMYSAVCGTGLDTIPLPGDVSQEALTAILADVSALALRLNKPLTARLMPLPGKQAGDETDFEFEFFANSRVMTPPNGTFSRLMAGDERITITPLHPRP